jgi:hypothetical protein
MPDNQLAQQAINLCLYHWYASHCICSIMGHPYILEAWKEKGGWEFVKGKIKTKNKLCQMLRGRKV